MSDRIFQCILWLSADAPEQLRSIDVDRVLMEAYEQDCFREFKEWLLSQSLQEATKAAVMEFAEEDCME